MGRTVLLIEPFVTIEVDSETDTLYVDWWGHVTQQNVLSGCNFVKDMLNQEQCSKVINNNTFVTGFWKATAVWASTVGLLELENTTCKYFAWVKAPGSNLPADYGRRLTLENVEVQVFDSYLAAEKWLTQGKVNKPDPSLLALDYH